VRRHLAIGVLSAVAAFQAYPPAFPRPNATKLVETDRFVVWDIVWPKGEPTPLHRHLYDQVGTYYQAGGRVITSLDGTKREATTVVGALSRTRRDTTHIEEGVTDPPLRAVFIELKHDNVEDVAVLDRAWRESDRPSNEGDHREAIWVFLSSGTLDVITRDGASFQLSIEPGQIRHVKPGTVETVRAVRDAPRAIIFGFK
jgi:hypothetical protein